VEERPGGVQRDPELTWVATDLREEQAALEQGFL
jgi:hypothetical protein